MQTLLSEILLAFTAGSAICATSAQAAPAYDLIATTPLGAPDRWDYVVPDSSTDRVYIAHGDRLAVIDARTGAVIGNVEGIAGGTHGTAISAATGQGFTDDGRNGQVIAFDPKTLKLVKSIPAAADADAIAADPLTGRIFVIEGDPGTITVLDPKTDSAIATINGGEKMEYAVADGTGAIFVAGEEKGDLLKIDARTNQVVGRWAMPGCASPHGLAYDKAGKRLFMGCTNGVMKVVNAGNGRVVATLAIGKGSDAVAFDPVRKRVFSSNGQDGTITIYQQRTPDHYDALEPLRTAVSGRTMGVDPATGHLFVAAADTEPNPTPGGRPHVVPGTMRVLVFAPAR
jgi:DNA-binding beta-propeller fold protein YncE